VLAVTRDGLADFITIRDSRGTPLVQVPASPPPSLPGAPAATEPVLTLRLAGGQPYFLVTAPVQGPAGREPPGGPGTAMAGRRVEGLGSLLDRLPARPAVVFVAGDRALAASRSDVPTSGWSHAATVGATTVGDEPFAVRRLAEPVVTSPDGGLWVMLSVREFARAEHRLLLEFLALLGGGAVVLAGIVLAFLPAAGRSRPPAGSGPPVVSPRVALERRNRELEALNAVFATMSRGSDLATTAGETLEVMRALARTDVGVIYRLDHDSSQLVLEGQSGIDPRYLDRSRNRPLEGSHMGDAVRTGEIIVTHLDASPPSEEQIREMAAERAHRTQLALPIPVEQRTWGVMVLVSKERREFLPEELAILRAVAQQVGLAVERAQLRDMAAVRLSRLEAQRMIERHISEHLDTEELLAVIARSAQRLIGGTFAALYLLEGDTLRPRAWSDVPDWIRDLRFKIGAGVAGAALAAGRGALANDYPSAPGAMAEFIPFTSRLLAAPLMAGDRPLGVMTAGRGPGAPPFTEDDLSTLTDFATQAAVALEHARLFDEATRNAAQYQALLEVSGAVSSTLDVDRVLDLVLERCQALLGVAAVGVMRIDRETGEVAYERGRGLSSAFTASLRMRVGEGTTGRAIEERAPVWSEDVLNDAALVISAEVRALIRREGYRAVLSVPLLSKGDVHGAIAAYWWEPHTPSAAEISVMTALAGQAATALDNARLFAQERDRKASLSSLLEINKKIGALAAPESLLTSIAEEAARLLDVDNAGFRLLEGEDLVVAGLTGNAARSMLRPRIKVGESLSGRVLATGQVLMCELEASDLLADHLAADQQLGYTHYLGVPLMVGERAIGVLTFRGRRAFTAREQELGETFAGQAAIAIDHSRLYREASEQAERMRAVAEIGRVLVSTLDEARVLEIVATQAHESLGRLNIAIWLQEAVGGPLHLVAGQGPFSGRFAGRAQTLNADEGVVGRALTERAPVWTADVLSDPRIQLRPESRRWIEEAGNRSILAVPLIREHLLGGLVVNRPVGQGFSSREVEYLSAFANQIAVALENARLYRALDVRVRELSVLHELSRSVAGQLDQAGILDTVHQQVPRVLDVRHMAVLLFDEEHDRLDVVLRVRDGRRCDDDEPRWYPRGQGGLSSLVFTSGRPIRTMDYVAECQRHGVTPVSNAMDMPHALIAPMTAGDRVIGLLVLRSPDRAFTDSDERLLGNIAQLVALMLRSARLYEERTRALGELGAAQDQLVRTEKLRALGEMASGVAHDFNNLLASILGRAQLLLERVHDVKLRQWLKVIERAALDGARTVRRLQDFTGIRRDQPAVAVDLNQVVEQVLETTESIWRQDRRRSGRAEIEVETDLAEDLPPVAGDPAELREAFTNLVLNAVDAMPEGGTLTLRTRTSDGHVAVEVRDTGTGIPEHIREKIFDPFFTTKGPAGTGLGLSMAYGILQRHNGWITVESDEGHGTIFRLLLPAAAAGSVGEEAPPLATAPGAPTSLHCLVVDDEQEVGAVVADILTSAGHSAVTVPSGEEAVERLGVERFDVVFTDLAMPGMTGWQVARAVRDRMPEVPVVMMSGFGVEVVPEDLPTHGVDLVLVKPLEIQDVLRALTTVRPGKGRP
jgi:GAF domain-containing protein